MRIHQGTRDDGETITFAVNSTRRHYVAESSLQPGRDWWDETSLIKGFTAEEIRHELVCDVFRNFAGEPSRWTWRVVGFAALSERGGRMSNGQGVLVAFTVGAITSWFLFALWKASQRDSLASYGRLVAGVLFCLVVIAAMVGLAFLWELAYRALA